MSLQAMEEGKGVSFSKQELLIPRKIDLSRKIPIIWSQIIVILLSFFYVYHSSLQSFKAWNSDRFEIGHRELYLRTIQLSIMREEDMLPSAPALPGGSPPDSIHGTVQPQSLTKNRTMTMI